MQIRRWKESKPDTALAAELAEACEIHPFLALMLTAQGLNTPEQIFEYLPLCDMALVMSVEPGFGGQKFMPIALDKIKTLSEYAKLKGLNYEIEVDGGINGETAPLAVNAGATVLVAGSYIFSAEDMVARVKEIKNL